MPESNDNRLSCVKLLAERELAAFLKATTGATSEGGMQWACNDWLHVLASMEVPDRNHEGFFRRVTIRAISQLHARTDTTVPDDNRCLPDESVDWQLCNRRHEIAGGADNSFPVTQSTTSP